MSTETFAEVRSRPPEQNAQELAGGFFRVSLDLPNRHFVPDIHQELAIQAIGEALASGQPEGHVEMATGTGKTLLVSLLAEAAVTTGKRVLILAPSVTIADQIVGHTTDTGLNKFTDLVDTKQVRQNYGSRRANDHTPVVVATYQSLLQEAKNSQPRLGAFDLILADECHRSLGPETSRVIKTYMPGAVRLGFSATPNFAEDRQSDEVFGNAIYEFSLRDAIEKGVTAPVRALLFETDQELKLTDSRREFTERELAPLMHVMERNGAAVKFVKDLVADGRQGIVACVPGGGNAHARLLANMLSSVTVEDRAIVALDVGSHLSAEEQVKRLAAFQRGACDVLTFTRNLEEGWDSDRPSFAINLAPTTSPLRTKQLLGRILRRNPDDKESIYIDFVDRTSGISKLQYTGLHALEVEDIDITRVLGGHRAIGKYPEHIADLQRLFSPELYERFMRNQGKVLREVLIRNTAEQTDPLVAEWEERLEAEGLPAELPDEFLPLAAMKAYLKAAKKLAQESGIPATYDEIMASLREASIPKLHYQLLSQFAIRLSLDEAYAAMESTTYVHDQELELEATYKALEKLVQTLDDRSEEVIRLRFGLKDGEPKTLYEIGSVFGATRERIRQVEARALSFMRHPQQSWALRSLRQETSDEGPRYNIDKPQLLRLYFMQLPPVVAGYDEADQRPYLVRLNEACEEWLYARGGTAHDAYRRLNDTERLANVAANLPSEGMLIHGKIFNDAADVLLHYKEARQTVSAFLTRSEELPKGRTVIYALTDGDITDEDMRFVFNRHKIDDGPSRDLDYSSSIRRMRLVAEENLELYDTIISRLTQDHPGLGEITKIDSLAQFVYDITKVGAESLSADRELVQAELTRTINRLNNVQNRPLASSSTDQREATRIWLQTRQAYLEQCLKGIDYIKLSEVLSAFPRYISIERLLSTPSRSE